MSEPAVGHNSNLNATQKRELAGIVREIERNETQKREIQATIGGIYNGAKERGFDTKALRSIIRERRMDQEQRDAYEHARDSYKHALGMLGDTPLGQAAAESAGRAATANGG